MSTEGLARLFRDNMWKLHGLPESIILDRGSQFTAGLMKELNKMLGIKSKLSTVFHPQTDRQTKRINQELEQYLRMFINHRQEQWPEWLGMAEFVYNNKAYSSTKMLPFKANYGQDPRMGFKGKKKGKYQRAEEFIEKIKEIQEEAKAVLGRAQEEMKKYMDRKRGEVDNYKVGDLVILSTKDLKYQMVRRRTEKLTERFVGCKGDWGIRLQEIPQLNYNLRNMLQPTSRRFLRELYEAPGENNLQYIYYSVLASLHLVTRVQKIKMR